MAKTITISAIRKDNKYPVVYTYKGAPNMFGGFDHSTSYRKIHGLSAIQAHTLNSTDTLVNNSGQPDSYFFPADGKLFEDFMLDNGVNLSAHVLGDRVHFQGSSTGDHSVLYDGDFARVEAHWQGYKDNAEQAYERWVNRDR